MQLRGVVLVIKIGFLNSFTHGGQFRSRSGLTFRCARHKPQRCAQGVKKIREKQIN